MPYRFKRSETVSEGTRRISAERIETALDRLDMERPLEAVHDVRKDIKKLRAVYRLVRSQIPASTFKEHTRMLRDTANLLAGIRDGKVKLDTLTKLQKTKVVTPARLSTARRLFERQYRKQVADFKKRSSAEKVQSNLENLLKKARKLEMKGDGWDALAPGFHQIFRAGREACDRIYDEPTSENLHEWRKRVKDLWYHARLIRSVWPEAQNFFADQLKILSEYLGDEHDLYVLRTSVAEELQDDKSGLQEELFAAIDERREELQECALELGSRVFAEKPKALCKRLGIYWNLWCSENGDPTQALVADHAKS